MIAFFIRVTVMVSLNMVGADSIDVIIQYTGVPTYLVFNSVTSYQLRFEQLLSFRFHYITINSVRHISVAITTFITRTSGQESRSNT